MKTYRVTTWWQATDIVEVPDDYDFGMGSLDEEWADQVDASGATLTDWEAHEGS